MRTLRFGAAEYISIRPLLHGLVSNGTDAHLCFEPPGMLVESYARGRYDAALIPGIEYLRGTGRCLLAGPALVARATPGGVVLVAQKPLDSLERIAVGEFCRTPVAALRIVLAEQYGVFPDIMVEKRIDEDDWRERYDAALFTGDEALRAMTAPKTEGVTRYNVTEMWKTLTRTPLVHAVWVYEDERLGTEIAQALTASRDLGLARLSEIADEVSRSNGMSARKLQEYFKRAWSYQLGERELDGLRALNEYARKYDLIRESRLVASIKA